MLRLREKYQKEAIPTMKEKFGYKNVMAIPKIQKVVVNVGFGKMINGKTTEERKKIENFIGKEISLITGQLPILTKAKQSISVFKLRRGVPIGMKVTLRGKRMYDFLERLINIVLPRVRDFRGISSSAIEERGNLNIGIREHIVFPEIPPEQAQFIFGFQITVVVNSATKETAAELFKLLGFPIK